MTDNTVLTRDKTLNIFERMAIATAAIERVHKNLTVTMGQNRNYKAVGEADVLVAVKPAEEQCGIYSYPFDREIIKDDIITTEKTYQDNKTTSNQLFMRIKVIYRFVNVDNPAEFIDIATYGDGIDSGDKAPGKAMTYADKYALLKAYKIETGDDPDKDGSADMKGMKNQTGPSEHPDGKKLNHPGGSSHGSATPPAPSTSNADTSGITIGSLLDTPSGPPGKVRWMTKDEIAYLVAKQDITVKQLAAILNHFYKEGGNRGIDGTNGKILRAKLDKLKSSGGDTTPPPPPQQDDLPF